MTSRAMDVADKFCIYAGTDVGTLEHTYCVPNEKIAYSREKTPSTITALELGRHTNELVFGTERGSGRFFNTVNNSFGGPLPMGLIVGNGPVTGVASLDSTVLFVMQDGIVNFYSENEGKKYNHTICDYFATDLEKNSTLDHISYNKSRQGVLGVGGKNNAFHLWDLETLECTFRAKNPIQVDDSIVGIANYDHDAYLNVCATSDGHILLYDDRVASKPVALLYNDTIDATCIATFGHKRECVLGTAEGDLLLVDFNKRWLKKIKLSDGAISKVATCLNEPLVATASKDHLQVFDLKQEETVYEMHMKGSISSLLMKVHDPRMKDSAREEDDENVPPVKGPAFSKSGMKRKSKPDILLLQTLSSRSKKIKKK